MSVKPCSSNDRPTGSAWSPPSSSRSQPPGRSHRGALRTTSSQQVRAVGAAVEGEARFERLDVAREQAERVRRHVRHHRRHDVDRSLEHRREWLVQGPLEHLDVVATGASCRDRVQLGRDDPCSRSGGGHHGRDRAGAGAQVDGDPRGREQGGRAPSQRFGLHPRHVDARLHDERDVSERDGARQPGERFAFGAPGDDRRKDVAIAGCRADQFVGFFGGGDAARLGQEGGDGLTVERRR